MGKINIIRLDTVDSTNEYLKRNAEIFPDGTVVRAKEQTRGKGRLGRNFSSPSGGLYFSMLLKNVSPEIIKYLTPAAAVAVMRGIEDVSDIKTSVKWVNDIMLGEKKICGILCESSFSGTRPDYIVTGIGINVRPPENGFPDEIKKVAGALADNADENFADRIFDAVCSRFFELRDAFPDKSFIGFYRERSCLTGKSVTLTRGGEKFDGTVKCVDGDCNLVLDTENGEMTFSSGTLHI
jgi:BirA family biotin operon repressor/biotin-[acetyl-CoA-carboxylase] ligase